MGPREGVVGPPGPFLEPCELAATGKKFPSRLGLCAFCVLFAPALLLWLLLRWWLLVLEALVLRGSEGYVCWRCGSLCERGIDRRPSICWITDVVVGSSVTSPGAADAEMLED